VHKHLSDEVQIRTLRQLVKQTMREWLAFGRQTGKEPGSRTAVGTTRAP
jgi:hypothetical protein